MLHRDVARPEPTVFKGFRGRFRLLQIALHHDIAAERDLALRLAIPGHRLGGFGVQDQHIFLQFVSHALAGFQRRPLGQRQIIPTRLFGTDDRRAVDLGQSVGVGHLDAHILHRRDHRRWWRRSCRHHLNCLGKLTFLIL